MPSTDAQVNDLLERVKFLEGRLESTVIFGHSLMNDQNALVSLKATTDGVMLPMDASWVLTCATLVFLMQLGFAQREAGYVQTKNVIATYVKNILDYVVGALVALLFGYGVAYNSWPLTSYRQQDSWKFFFHLVYQTTAATIVSGALACRIRMDAYVVLTVTISGLLFSTAVRWTWGGGWLSQREYPFQDFAGSAVVHLLGGAAATASAWILGPRKGRFDPEKAREFAPHSVPSMLSGALLLWVGWYGFNPGSTGEMSSFLDAQIASNAAMTTTLAGAMSTATMFTYMYWQTKGEAYDVLHLVNSMLAGLVAITAGCDRFSATSSLAVGFGACFVYYQMQQFIVYLKIDDVVSAGPVHAAAGAWGTIAVGLFDPTDGLFYISTGNPGLLISQIYGVFALAALGAIPCALVCLLMQKRNILRVSEKVEEVGIDLSVFKMTAYKEDDITSSAERTRAVAEHTAAYQARPNQTQVDQAQASLMV